MKDMLFRAAIGIVFVGVPLAGVWDLTSAKNQCEESFTKFEKIALLHPSDPSYKAANDEVRSSCQNLSNKAKNYQKGLHLEN
jgi:hypothetical protein